MNHLYRYWREKMIDAWLASSKDAYARAQANAIGCASGSTHVCRMEAHARAHQQSMDSIGGVQWGIR